VRAEVISDNRAVIYVPEKFIAGIIGREGVNIRKLEQKLGIGLDVQPLGAVPKKPSKEIPYQSTTTSKQLEFLLGDEYAGKDVDIFLHGEYLATFAVSKKGVVRIKKSNKLGKTLLDAVRHREKVSFVSSNA